MQSGTSPWCNDSATLSTYTCICTHVHVRVQQLTFDTLNRVDHHSNCPCRQSFKALLGVDVYSGQPAPKAGVWVVPANNHLRPPCLLKHVQHLCLKDRIHSLNTHSLRAVEWMIYSVHKQFKSTHAGYFLHYTHVRGGIFHLPPLPPPSPTTVSPPSVYTVHACVTQHQCLEDKTTTVPTIITCKYMF